MSKIAWTDTTWNVVTGCSKVSDGCRYCYAERLTVQHNPGAKPWTAPNAPEVVRLRQAISLKQGKTVHVRHAFDVIPITKGQGKVLISMSFDQCDEFIRRYEEGRAKEDFNLSLAVTWLEHEEPAA